MRRGFKTHYRLLVINLLILWELTIFENGYMFTRWNECCIDVDVLLWLAVVPILAPSWIINHTAVTGMLKRFDEGVSPIFFHVFLSVFTKSSMEIFPQMCKLPRIFLVSCWQIFLEQVVFRLKCIEL